MRQSQSTLFRVALHDGYYADSSPKGFVVEPTLGCQQILNCLGLQFRQAKGAFGVYSLPPTNAHAASVLEKDHVVFRFLLRLAHPYLLNMLQLLEDNRAQRLFYFNNLREDREEGRRYLGDSTAGRRMGLPVRSVFGSVYTYSFTSPVRQARLKLQDMFGNTKLTTSFDFRSSGRRISSYHVNLQKIERTPPGRYILSDNLGGSEAFYYDPALQGQDVFGMVEIYNRTDGLTADCSNYVPKSYRFLEGGAVTARGVYTLKFEPRASVGRGIVAKGSKA